MNRYDDASWGSMAKKYNLRQTPYGPGTGHYFPPHWSNGWIVEVSPVQGLYVSSAWFTPNQTIVHKIDIKDPVSGFFALIAVILFILSRESCNYIYPYLP